MPIADQLTGTWIGTLYSRISKPLANAFLTGIIVVLIGVVTESLNWYEDYEQEENRQEAPLHENEGREAGYHEAAHTVREDPGPRRST